jgi:hypothetical protein
MVLEGDPVQGGGRIDLRTGEVWPQSAIEYAEEVGEIDEEDDDPERWLWVECGVHDGYRDMEWFIDDLDDPQFAFRLARAISGRGAFRSVQGHPGRPARADDTVVGVLQRPPTRASPQLVGDRGLHADQAVGPSIGRGLGG